MIGIILRVGWAAFSQAKVLIEVIVPLLSQKGLLGNMQSDEKQGPAIKITLLNKANIQNLKRIKEILRTRKKAKALITTKTVLREMLMALL